MIASGDLARLMQSSTPHALLDVREKAAYERGHIYRATSLPRRLVEFRLPALVPARATPLVVSDEDGRLAALTLPTLGEIGYTDVRLLAGGLAGWRSEGRPLVEGINVPSKVFGERVLHEHKTPQLTPLELWERIERGDDLVIVDARTPEEYARGSLPGAWSVPGGELVVRIAELVRHPETTIVVHCGGRTRSYIGAESLRRMQLANPVVVLENGTMGWELAGLTLERGAARWAPAPSARSRAVAALAAKRVAAEDGIPFVSPRALAARLARREDQNLYVLDVRTADEYAAGHVAGAVWAPGGQAVQATDEYVAVRAASIVLVCDGFARSVMTASWLRRMGLPDVAVLAGGLPAWTADGGAVETGLPLAVPVGWETARARVARVSPGDLGPALIVSVDQSDAYARGHMPGAWWLCRSRLEWTIGTVAPDRQAPIIVTCADGFASTLAAATLGRLGYTAVSVLEGGTRAWVEAAGAVESGPTRLGDEPDDVVLKPYERGRAAMERYLSWEAELDAAGHSRSRLL
ncbi:MAG: sulfurtransferase [Candidatus Rokuibacteriota bacterium]|nr:MAG: sulfurtransferase [Candidatus Rokubacteria bacterium]PYN70671.1 MAG: sulfurtransferase [Candidatus Rokubacteria bacterium]